MADNDDTGTLIQFPRVGFNLDPGTTLPGPIPPLPDTAPFTSDPTTGTPNLSGRRSPLDTLAAMPDPGLALPVISLPQPGQIPDTFRSEPDRDHVAPRLGALSLAAILAVAIAAMRGIHGVVTAWGANRAERKAAADTQTPGPKDKGGKGGGKKVPSGADYGRKTLNRSNGNGGGRSGGGSGKTSGSTGGGGGKRTSPKTKTSPKPGGGSGSAGGGLSSGRKTSTRKTPGSKDTSRNTKRTPAGKDQAVKNRRTPSSRTGSGGAKSSADTLKKQQKKDRKNLAGGSGRTSLTDAAAKQAQKAADRRLERRRKNLTSPALWGGDNTPSKKKTPKNAPNSKKQGPGRTSFTQAAKKQAVKAAERRWKRRQKKTTVPPASPNANTHKTPKSRKAPTNTRRTGTSYWARFRNRRHAKKPTHSTGPTPGPTPGPGTGAGAAGGTAPGGRQGRKTPWQAAAGAHTDTVITLERLDNVGDQARRHPEDPPTPFALPATGPAALDAAPTPHTPRPGTSRPRPMPPAPTGPDPRIKEHRRMATHSPIVQAAGRQMDAQHATEITLDDALDEYGAFKDDAFKTHDQSAKLAERARHLRDVLAAFAEDLAVNHNLIGPLFSAAMFRMSESMDLVARMSEEMKTSSLEAAELAESADNDLNDTYRPYTQATADAGLTTPSAPIHNNV